MSDRRKLLEAYQADLELQGLAEGTVQNYLGGVRVYLDYLDGTDLGSVGVEELRGFLGYLTKGQDLAASTVNGYFAALASLHRFLQYEGLAESDPVPGFRKRYLGRLRREAGKSHDAERQLLSVEELSRLVHYVMDVRDRAVLVLLAKTGVRRQELVLMDVDDIDWREQSILLKPRPKRSNRVVFFDDEAARTLQRWMAIRRARGGEDGGPLFLSQWGNRLDRNAVYNAVRQPAEDLGFHDPEGSLREKFTPHCLRHWFTTHLRRSGMQREYIAWLRGDTPTSAMDIYYHIDPGDVREAYRAHIPRLGI